MTTQNIIKLKIHRNEAGSTVPFDTLYFVPKGQQTLIPDVFKYAIVLPVDKKMLHNLRAHLKPTNTKTVSGPSHERLELEEYDINRAGRADSWWKEFVVEHELNNCVAVIPVLTRKARKKLTPRYLASQRWWRMYDRNNGNIKQGLDSGKLKKPISEDAYLITPLPAPHNKIQPICSVCKRAMHNLTGQCTPGMPICYQSLDMNRIISADDNEDEDSQDASV